MYKDFRKLNLACGDNKIKDAWNVDIVPENQPDEVVNILKPLPYEDNSFSHVYLFHTIEHLQETVHESILKEIWRVLEPDGFAFFSYPEFRICAQHYINNYQGDRAFWKATIYGLQRTIYDFHITLMDTEEFKRLLTKVGFHRILALPEVDHAYNTLVSCRKTEPQLTYEDLLRKEVYER